VDARPATYNRIGIDYSNLRKPDPRIAARIHAALGSARTVLNVGAGTGSYEPTDRKVTALEPSAEMIGQRSADAAPAIEGRAEQLPFGDDSFDASMAVLTIHHWTDQAKGLREIRRVTRGPVVILTFDPAHRGCWLTDYLPALVALDEQQMPPLSFYGEHLGEVEIAPVPVPRDCSDSFLYAFWARPQAYLDPRLRRGSSSFWAIPDVGAGLARLEADLASGKWSRLHAGLADLNELDCGYRLIVARDQTRS
jgi:SAM-dependent methyltransferase